MFQGAALYSPQANLHVCTSGPTWSAIVLPTSDHYSGLCKVDDTWIATGHGQAGTTPSNSIISTTGGQSWTAGGTMPNIGNTTPFSLRAGAHNGWAIAYGGSTQSWVTRDKGASWSAFSTGVGFNCKALDSGNNKFVFLDTTAAFTYSSASGAALETNASPATLSRAWWIANRGVWLCFENGGTRSWTTPDLKTFTAGPTMPYDGGDITPYSISQLGSNIVIVYAGGVSHNAAYSLDNGISFTASATWPGGVSQSYSVAHGNGIVVATIALGSSTIVSTDSGANWITGPSNTTTKTWILTFDTSWFALGDSGSSDTVGNIGVC